MTTRRLAALAAVGCLIGCELSPQALVGTENSVPAEQQRVGSDGCVGPGPYETLRENPGCRTPRGKEIWSVHPDRTGTVRVAGHFDFGKRMTISELKYQVMGREFRGFVEMACHYEEEQAVCKPLAVPQEDSLWLSFYFATITLADPGCGSSSTYVQARPTVYCDPKIRDERIENEYHLEELFRSGFQVSPEPIHAEPSREDGGA